MSDQITIIGKVEKLLDLQEFPSGFSKRTLVILTEDKYPQTIPVEFVKDNTELLNGITEGQPVTAYVNLRGNEYNGKYYANITGWKLDTVRVDPTKPKLTVDVADKPTPGIPTLNVAAEIPDGDIPF